MKKLPLLTIISAGVGLLASCNLTPTGTTTTSQDPIATDPTTTQGTHNLYAFEAATSIGLLDYLGDSSPAPALHVRKAQAETPSETPAVSETIKEYLPTVEAALLGDEILADSVAGQSNREGYTSMLTITYKDITLQSNTFEMHFNETIIEDKDDDDDDDWDDRHEKDDQEQESFIEGIVVVGENEYPMRGMKELENDEFEVEFRYILGENSYIEVKQEKELGESEFEYTVVENGRKTLDYSLEVEDNEVDLEIRDRANMVNVELKFDLFVREGRTFIRAKVEEGRNKTTYLYEKTIDQATGNATYVLVA